MLAQILVERAQEAFAAVGVVFPGVLAVQDHADKGRLLAAAGFKPLDEVGRGLVRLVLGVDEADGV